MKTNKILMITAVFIVVVFGNLFLVSAQEATVCCSQTIGGALCQNVPANECAPGSQQVPTSCDSTSFCKAGTCYDSSEGTCLDNTPQLVCNNNGGVWSEASPPQCSLGCCILGDQAAFVSLVRCKKLSAQLGLQTNYKGSINNEVACVLEAASQEKGACVYEFEFEKTCKFTTRAECSGSSSAGNGTVSNGVFYPDKLCSAEELGTTCGPTEKTSCLPGKDEVYFLDSCGNPANIYDASKVTDKEYWTNIKDKSESCSPGSGNAGSASCGNCNYLQGSYCRSQDSAGGNPSYGDFICADLNCNDIGKRHGESWCVFKDAGTTGEGENSVGSRFYKNICINGEVTVESCDDFRAEECIQDSINGFSQAACRVNRWQDCVAQLEQADCENSDRRDCLWKEGEYLGMNVNQNGTPNFGITGSCLPKNPPGLTFWEGDAGKSTCAVGNYLCVVTFEKGIFGKEACKENCECLTDQWEKERAAICRNLGDCGPAVNWIGKDGYKKGFKIQIGTPEDFQTPEQPTQPGQLGQNPSSQAQLGQNPGP